MKSGDYLFIKKDEWAKDKFIMFRSGMKSAKNSIVATRMKKNLRNRSMKKLNFRETGRKTQRTLAK